MLDTDLPALQEQAWSLVEAGRLAEARLLFKTICETDASDPEAWMMLGSLHAEFSDDGQASVCLQKAIEIDPLYPDAHFNLARVLVRQGRVADAHRHCRIAVENDPAYAAAWQLMGAIQEALGNFADSEACSRRSIGLLPLNAVSHANLALALWKQGRLSESVQSYRKSLDLDPRQPDVWLQLAAVHTHLDAFAEAEQGYRKAISLRPESLEAYERLGDILARQGRIEAEIEVLLAALRVEPGQVAVLIRLGKAYHARKQWDAAIRSFREALSLAPDNAEAHFGLGAVFGAQDMKQQEMEHFRHAQRLDPENEQYRFHVARLAGVGALPSAPREYVRTLFDACAESFDDHLVGQLAYRGPELVHRAVMEQMDKAGAPGASMDVLDLGCGTGLCAPLFRPLAASLCGIDLSERMVEVAGKRNLYDRLVVGDIAAELERVDQAHDLIIAADVFIYVGDLARVMALCAAALKQAGWFAFTVEAARDESADFVLEPTGRYSHTVQYLRTLARSTGLQVCSVQNAVLRTERERPINGYVVIMRR